MVLLEFYFFQIYVDFRIHFWIHVGLYLGGVLVWLGWLADWLTRWLARFAGWLARRQDGSLIRWLVGWYWRFH